ncbi:MAG: O-antigen ligase family protein [Ruminococcus sp.]
MIRIALIVVSVFILNMINLTLARSCLLGAVVFLFLLFIGFIRKKKLSKLISSLCILFPIIFVAIYFSLIENEWFINTFSFLVSEGKTLTSRVGIWQNAIDIFKESPIFGSYFNVLYGENAQLHNMSLDILVSYGPIVFILFIFALFKFTGVNRIRHNSTISFAALCGFFAIIIMSAFEAGLVGGSTGLNFFTATLLLIYNSCCKESNV